MPEETMNLKNPGRRPDRRHGVSMIAEARPMGGGRRSAVSRKTSAVCRRHSKRRNRRHARPAGAGARQRHRWPHRSRAHGRAFWAALLGLGLGALFSHFGLGGAMASALGSILMLVLLAGVFFIIRLIRGKSQPAAQPAAFGGNNVYPMQPSAAGNATPEIGSRLQPAAAPVQPAHTPWGVPADFDSASFLRVAKAISSACKRWDRAIRPISANSPRRKCLPS
jgi:predicted lipid-binding transport protein (Tim44 family)